MIVEFEDAIRAYLIVNMRKVTGSSAITLPVYMDKYPPGCAECCLMVHRLPGSADGTICLNRGSFEIWSRHRDPKIAKMILKNIDRMLHALNGTNLSDTVRCIGCAREQDPQRLDQEANDLVRYFSVYGIIAAEL